MHEIALRLRPLQRVVRKPEGYLGRTQCDRLVQLLQECVQVLVEGRVDTTLDDFWAVQSSILEALRLVPFMYSKEGCENSNI